MGSKFCISKFSSNRICKMSKSWNNLVSVVTTLWSGQLKNRVWIPSKDKGFFFFIRTCRPALESSQPPIQWVLVALSLGIKRLRHEADHLPLSSIEVKNEWSYTFTPPCSIIVCTGIIWPLCLYKMLSVRDGYFLFRHPWALVI
jgi:hypothetical protein